MSPINYPPLLPEFSKLKYLLINIFGIGDVLFTTPLISNIKAFDPSATIDFLCNKRVAPLLEANPQINKIYIYEKDDYALLFRKSRRGFFCKVRVAFQEISREKYDVAIDLSQNKYLMFCLRLAAVKKRIGFNFKKRSGSLTDKIDLPDNGFEGAHALEYYLRLLEPLGIPAQDKMMKVFLTSGEMAWAEQSLKDHGIYPEDLLVGLVPGGGISWGQDVVYRRWPAGQYSLLADKIIAKLKAKVILLGDSSEEELGKSVARAMQNKVVSFVGQTTLRQYLSLLRACRLVVMNDGGPLHMAVAAGTRTVSLMGPVDERVYGPFPPAGHAVVTKNIACRPCYRNFRRADCDHLSCLRTIIVEEVFRAVEKAIID
jgi:lipopolysaccharide heptosyltransferase II